MTNYVKSGFEITIKKHEKCTQKDELSQKIGFP